MDFLLQLLQETVNIVVTVFVTVFATAYANKFVGNNSNKSKRTTPSAKTNKGGSKRKK
ncbi:hypothetical protein [Bacillus manliponensis]|uniref:hypothetical protein n=1 Tax=Bacillus manliponensis TaxID=574376 RepID=UPI000A7A20ED|nr:hypothetical protein [Bacillus manliponensis]